MEGCCGWRWARNLCSFDSLSCLCFKYCLVLKANGLKMFWSLGLIKFSVSGREDMEGIRI